jgi:sugar transferase (PEP-CTERM/EpsH1 system associated)
MVRITFEPEDRKAWDACFCLVTASLNQTKFVTLSIFSRLRFRKLSVLSDFLSCYYLSSLQNHRWIFCSALGMGSLKLISRMNILFVVPYMPNLIRARSYNTVRKLAERGHKVHLATLWTDDEERKNAEELKKYCKSVQAFSMPVWRSLANSLVALPTTQPLQAWYSWQPQLARQALVSIPKEQIDVVHVEHLRGVKYGLYLKSHWPKQKKNFHPCPPIVWDSVDCISYLFRQSAVHSKRRVFRWITQLELERTERFEAELTRQFPAVLVTSQKDKNALLELENATQQSSRLAVVGNGVDLEYFHPDPEVERNSTSIVVSGKMSYHANVSMTVHLFEHIMPFVWERHPEAKLWIVGKDPAPEVKEMANHPNVTVTGMVPELRLYLQRAAISVAPLTYGAGIQNKVLEAMACGTPVVATPLAVSALNGLVFDRDVMVAEEPAEFASKVIRLLDDACLRQVISAAGRRYVEQHRSWDHLVAQLEEVYHGVIKNDYTP